jgi:hypothetical protein
VALVRVKGSDREVVVIGSLTFAFLALVLAFGAIATAAQAVSRSKDTAAQVSKMAGTTAIGSTANVTLQEFSIKAQPGLVQSGKVKFVVTTPAR